MNDSLKGINNIMGRKDRTEEVCEVAFLLSGVVFNLLKGCDPTPNYHPDALQAGYSITEYAVL